MNAEYSGATSPFGKRIRVEEPAGVAREGEFVRFGVPFEQGAWPANAPMGLSSTPVSGRGRVLACDWQLTQRWDDGSVRLAFCTAEIEMDAQATIELEPGAEHLLPELSPRDQSAIEGLSVMLSIDGKSHTVPLRADADADSGAFSPFHLRIEGAEISGEVHSLGGRSVGCSMTLCNCSVEEMGIDLLRIVADGERLLGGESMAQLGAKGDFRLEEAENPAFLQLGRTGYLTSASQEPIEFQYPIGGECRQNYLWGRLFGESAGASIAVRNMGENFPCGISLGRGKVHIDLWPGEAGAMTLAGGMSKTWEFGVVFDGGRRDAGGLPAVQSIHHPLVAALPTSRLETLGCFGTFAPYLPRKYPKLESWIKWIMANKPRAYGWKNFGDEPAFGYMARAKNPDEPMFVNSEYDFPLIALGQFCRTGEKLAYEDGRAAVLHMMDIDTVVADTDPMKVGGQYSHSPDHTTHPPAPDHEWLEGLLLWYVLTGDRRAAESARALADRHLRLAKSGMFDKPGMTSRRYGWPLIALSSFYAFSREQQYLDGAERIVRGMKLVEEQEGSLRSPYWGLPFKSLDTFMLGIATSGLCRFHAVTGRTDIEEMILRACDALASLETPEGVLPYKEYPLLRLNEPASTTITLEALAYGYALSGNREYLRLGARNLENTFEMLRSGFVLEWNAEERKSFPGGAYMRAKTVEMNAQFIGLLLRGIWPFMATADAAGLFQEDRNPFGYRGDRI